MSVLPTPEIANPLHEQVRNDAAEAVVQYYDARNQMFGWGDRDNSYDVRKGRDEILPAIDAAFTGPAWERCETEEDREKFAADIAGISCAGMLDGRETLEHERVYPTIHGIDPSYVSDMQYVPSSKVFKARGWFVNMYGQSPSITRRLVEDRVFGFHCSAAPSLLPILEEGFVPLESQRQEDRIILTGERVFAGEELRKGVSAFKLTAYPRAERYFSQGGETPEELQAHIDELEERLSEGIFRTHIQGEEAWELYIQELEQLKRFLEQSPDSERDALIQHLWKNSFPVAYFINGNAVAGDKTKVEEPGGFGGLSGEVLIRGSVDPEDISCIVVPRNNIPAAEKICEITGSSVRIYPMETMKQLAKFAAL